MKPHSEPKWNEPKTNPKAELKPSLVRSFLSKVEIQKGSECWHWSGAKSSRGYGQFRSPLTPTNGRPTGISAAHRVSLWMFRGIDPGTGYVDHICCVKTCVNPYHLRLLEDNSENTARGNRNRNRKDDPDFDPWEDIEWQTE